MRKKLPLVLLLFVSVLAFAKIQNQDIKSEAELVAAGATAASLPNDDKIWVKANSINKTLNAAIAAGDIGGGGVEYGDMLKTLDLDEARSLATKTFNEFLDSFNTSQGTLSNTEIAGSTLRLSSGQLTGNYQRTKETTTTLSKLNGIAKIVAQAIAPKNTVVSSNAFKIQGDVTGYFPVSSNVAIFKQISTDAETAHVYLKTGNPARVALLPVNARSYNSGADETTLTLTNTDALDLDLDVGSSDYNTKLRIIPFDHDFQIRTTSGGSYEDVTVDDAHTTGNVKIPAPSYFSALGSLTGTILHSAYGVSPNGQYGVVRINEAISSDSTWHWYYSIDSLKTWTKFAATKTSGNIAPTNAEDFDTLYLNSNAPGPVVVANNGKIFSIYMKKSASTGTNPAVFGVYSDLTAGTPALSDSATTPVDSGNNGAVAGQVFHGAAVNYYGAVAGDTTDLSYVAVLGVSSGNSALLRTFIAGGATHDSLSGSAVSVSNAAAYWLHVTGTGVAHRVTGLIRNDTSAAYNQFYYDQGSTTVNGNSLISTNATRAGIASAINGSKAYLAMRDVTNTRVVYLSGTTNSTPSYGSEKVISGNLDVDLFDGGTTGTNEKLMKNQLYRAIVNPSNANHVIFAMDLVHPDSVRRATLVEVTDDTNFLGNQISQFTTDAVKNLRDLTANTERAQTMNLTSQRFRTYSQLAYQVGSIAAGSTLYAEIRTVSGGVPTATVLATSTNTYDPSKLTKSTSGQWLHFNFANITPGTGDFAVVIKGTFAISASNYIALKHHSSSATYAGGSNATYDGATWTAEAGDLAFNVNGEYVIDISSAYEATNSPTSVLIDDQETAIVPITSTTFQVTTRRVNPLTSTYRALAGHQFSRILTIGSGNLISSLSSEKVVGYNPQQYEPYMVFATALGDTLHSRKNTITGVVSSTEKGEDRSGMNLPVNTYTAMTWASDSEFQQATAGEFNGTSSTIEYTDQDLFNIVVARPFMIEAEIKNISTSGNRVILSHYSASATGWRFQLTSGFLSFTTSNSGGTTVASVVASDATELTSYHRVRFVWDGTQGSLYRSTAGSPSVFTQVASYSTRQTLTAAANNSTLRIGSASGADFFSGRIGYVKFAQNVTSFAYSSGYYFQPPLYGVNMGKYTLMEQKIGQNTTGNLLVSFDRWGVASTQPSQESFADSYEDIFVLKHTMAVTGSLPNFKTTFNRGTTDDSSYATGLLIRMSR